MKRLLGVTLTLLVALAAAAPETEASALDLPGFDFIVERIKHHGYAGRAMDIKGRPYTTLVMTLNDEGPIYFALGLDISHAGKDRVEPLAGFQYDAMHLWKKARDSKYLSRMKMIRLPEDWKLLGGPMLNFVRTTPDKYRIDRDVIFNAALQVGFGGAPKKPDDGGS